MSDRLIEFLQSPNRDTYLAIRELVITSDDYDPYSDEIDTVQTLYEQQRVGEACETLEKAMGNLLLSPEAHHLLGFLHHELGDEEAARIEVAIAQTCIEGILATGDGSSDNPYIVVRTSDEYDALEYFEKQLKQQSLIHKGDRHFDLLQCTDGSEYWFDITDSYNRLSKRFET